MAQISDETAKRVASVGFLVQSLARKYDAIMLPWLEEIDLSPKLFPSLMMLREEDGVNQTKLGERLKFPQYFTSRNVEALVKAGFVERRPDPESRRAILLFLTKAGRIKADLLPGIVRKVNDQVLREFAVEERENLTDLLQRANNSN